MVSIICLNPRGYMRTGAPDRQRALESAPLFLHFKAAKVHDISNRAMIMARIYPGLSQEAKTTLLHPHIFPVFLGVKDAYIQYDGEPDMEGFAQELSRIPIATQNYGLFFSDHYSVDINAFRNRIGVMGHLISDIASISAQDIDDLANGDLHDIKWHIKLRDMLEGCILPSERRTVIHGFLMGYPLADIAYCMKLEHKGCPARDCSANARTITNYFGNMMLSDHHKASERLLTGWEIAMKYGYRLLSQYRDFWDNFDVGLENSTSWIPLKGLTFRIEPFSPPPNVNVN